MHVYQLLSASDCRQVLIHEQLTYALREHIAAYALWFCLYQAIYSANELLANKSVVLAHS